MPADDFHAQTHLKWADLILADFVETEQSNCELSLAALIVDIMVRVPHHANAIDLFNCLLEFMVGMASVPNTQMPLYEQYVIGKSVEACIAAGATIAACYELVVTHISLEHAHLYGGL